MKIREIHIENFRAIDRLDLTLTGPGDRPVDLAALAGPNGCGKTSVIEACLWALKQEQLLAPRPVTLADCRRSDAAMIRVEILTEHREENCGYLRQWLADQAKPDDSQTFRVEDPVPFEYFSSWRYPKLVGSVSVTVGRRGKRPAETEENRLWRLKQHLVNLTARRAFTGSEGAGAEGGAVFSRLNEAWRLFYPRQGDRFVAAVAGESVEDGYDVFVEGDKRPRIGIDQLSSGEIEVLCMLGHFVMKDFAGGIVFIDEPELHLHPAWHRTILRALRTLLPDTQLICATHSSEVLESVYSFERFTLLPPDDPRVRLGGGHG